MKSDRKLEYCEGVVTGQVKLNAFNDQGTYSKDVTTQDETHHY